MEEGDSYKSRYFLTGLMICYDVDVLEGFWIDQGGGIYWKLDFGILQEALICLR